MCLVHSVSSGILNAEGARFYAVVQLYRAGARGCILDAYQLHETRYHD